MQTKHMTLDDVWMQIGTGPALVEAQTPVRVHFGPTAPPADTPAYHILGGTKPGHVAVQATVPIWARSASPAPASIVISE